MAYIAMAYVVMAQGSGTRSPMMPVPTVEPNTNIISDACDAHVNDL